MKNSRKKSAAKKKKKPADTFIRRHSMALLIAGASLLLVVIAAAMFVMHPYGGEATWLIFDRPLGKEALADTLKTRLGSSTARRVMTLYSLQGGDPERLTGAYRVDNGANPFTIARSLATRRQTPVNVTFNNVRTLDKLAERLTRNIALSPADFLAAADSVLPAAGFRREQFAAAFIPDTYEVYYTVSGPDLVSKLVKAHDNFWNDRRRAKAGRLGLTPVEVATLASIVEEETAKPDERPKVARVYLNRLARGMKLQADPTVKFACGDFAAQRISGAMLAKESPYNTYRVAGLPPGPIRVADASAIDAVLDAPAHDYIYMCAREDFSGYHNFATDYATHAANARRYQAELDRLNIH